MFAIREHPQMVACIQSVALRKVSAQGDLTGCPSQRSRSRCSPELKLKVRNGVTVNVSTPRCADILREVGQRDDRFDERGAAFTPR